MGQSVSERAYQIYIEEGSPEGRHLEHWLRAESEILGSSNGISTPKKPRKSTSTANGTKTRRTSKSKAKSA